MIEYERRGTDKKTDRNKHRGRLRDREVARDIGGGRTDRGRQRRTDTDRDGQTRGDKDGYI